MLDGVEPRTALWIAVVAAGGAIAIVATDTVLGLEAKLETRTNEGAWELVWQAPEDTGRKNYAEPYPVGYYGGCANPTLRLTVYNRKPLSETVEVGAFAESNGTRLWRETWELGSYETRVKEFTVPASARPPDPVPKDPYYRPQAQIRVYADELVTWPCVQYGEASS